MPKQLVNKQPIYQWIVENTPPQARVLDIGCGSGELLARLVEQRGVRGTGIEISEQHVMQAVQRGLSVHHGNVEEGLDHYGPGSFDLVIISLTIQEILNPPWVVKEALRVGSRLIVVFPNFGHWRIRWQLGLCGRAPETQSFPYKWYETPNRRFFTVHDWDAFCRQEHLQCINRAFLRLGRSVRLLPNLRAEVAMYLMERSSDGGSAR